MVDARLEELDLDEAELVVQALELAEEAVNEGESVVPGLLGHVEGDEADLKVLALESPAFRGGPLDAVFRHGDLDISAVGDLLDEIQKLSD